jgi:hypothetical protein
MWAQYLRYTYVEFHSYSKFLLFTYLKGLFPSTAQRTCLPQSFHHVMGANARGHTYIAVSTALVVLSTVVVGIRIAARWVKSNLGWDDYAICISIVLAYSMLGQAIFCTVPKSQQDHSRLIMYRGPRWRTRKAYDRANCSRENYLPTGEYHDELKAPYTLNTNRSVSSQTKSHTPSLSPA